MSAKQGAPLQGRVCGAYGHRERGNRANYFWRRKKTEHDLIQATVEQLHKSNLKGNKNMKTNFFLMSFAALSLLFTTGCSEEDADFRLKSIKISPTSAISVAVNETQKLTAIAEPSGAVMVSVWSSEDVSIATIDSVGVLTGVKEGKTNILATSGDIQTSVEVTVWEDLTKVREMTVDLEELTLRVGEQREIVVTLVPAASTVDVKIESDHPDVAAVDGKVITGVGSGEATITVAAGLFKETIHVLVGDPDASERNLWKTHGVSSEWQGEFLAGRAFDGNVGSFWHSDAAGPLPQWMAVDMQIERNIKGFLFTNRQDVVQTSRPKHIVFEISNNGENWEVAYENEALPNLLQQQILPLEGTKSARYFRVTILSTWSGAPYTYIAELDLYSGEAPAPNPGPEVDLNWIVTVSSVFADLTGDNLIDGDPATAWHSNVGDGQPWAIIDFRQAKTLHGIYYWRRDVDNDPAPKHIRFSVGNVGSKEAGDWTLLLEDRELENPVKQYKQTLVADAPQTGQYLLIEILSTWNGAPYSFIGEIDIKETPYKAPIYLNFSKEGINNLDYERVDDYYVLKASGVDPYVYFESLPQNIGAATAHIRMKYKSSVAVTTAEWFFFPNGAGHYSSGASLRMDAASDWTEWSYEFEVKDGMETGAKLRFDLPNDHPADFYIKDLRIAFD
jgi:hypothetical protein